jgi:hypothetical protein
LPEVWWRGELSAETRFWCVVLLGRDDIVTRLEVESDDLGRVRDVVGQLASVAAAVLVDAW